MRASDIAFTVGRAAVAIGFSAILILFGWASIDRLNPNPLVEASADEQRAIQSQLSADEPEPGLSATYLRQDPHTLVVIAQGVYVALIATACCIFLYTEFTHNVPLPQAAGLLVLFIL